MKSYKTVKRGEAYKALAEGLEVELLSVGVFAGSSWTPMRWSNEGPEFRSSVDKWTLDVNPNHEYRCVEWLNPRVFWNTWEECSHDEADWADKTGTVRLGLFGAYQYVSEFTDKFKQKVVWVRRVNLAPVPNEWVDIKYVTTKIKNSPCGFVLGRSYNEGNFMMYWSEANKCWRDVSHFEVKPKFFGLIMWPIPRPKP